ncbi:hypothetical protein ACLD0U_00540 [Microbacterium sp. 2216-1]|uniref:hypothetical protein n=1 Tax=Microbacterium TaxID=33882 RepID=UPI0015CA2C1C|nr:hypothetical protein [Microbacterium esteraromaticum]MBY6060032.1 hypothetical protein [Microbacterium esteraromaticum]
MATAEIVRLKGEEEEVVAIAVAAKRTVAYHRDLQRELMPQLSALHAARREITTPHPQLQTPSAEVDARGRGIVWTILFAVSLVAAVVAVAMLSPLGPRTKWVSPEAAVQIAMPALIIAAIAGVGALILRPARGRAAVATVLSSIVTILLAAVFLFRLVGGGGDRGFTAEQLGPWLAGAGILLVVLIALTWRLDHLRRSDVFAEGGIPKGNREAQADARRVRESARRAAKLTPATAAARDELRQQWAHVLRQRGARTEAADQAAEIGPVAWLVWTVYDGDLDVSLLLR